ncbi:MAG: immunity 53 family protein [Rhizobacter sp.]|nr:immunity 53 family protein [Chlorobiales bacterium]
MDETLEWIQKWYHAQCNEDWEHTFGVKIDTVDNPGWWVEIDLAETELERFVLEEPLHKNSEEDWYFIKVEDSKFTASGDPSKLIVLLKRFREIVEAEAQKNHQEV